MKKGYIFSDPQRKQVTRIVFGLILFALLYRFFSNSLLHQLQFPVLKYSWVDLSFWAAHLIKIPEFLTGNFWIALTFDLLLVGSAASSLFFLKRSIFPIVFSVLFAFYFVTYNSFSAYHTHCMVGILLITVPFWFRDNKSMSLLWEGLRYFTCFIYFSAFLWKILRGALFNSDQGVGIFMNEGGAFLIQNPGSVSGQLFAYFTANPEAASMLVIAGVIVEAFFIVGFFTRRFDLILFTLPILFHFITWMLLDVFFFELLILNLTFLPVEWFTQRSPRTAEIAE